jgi:hypothetical protein
MNFHIFVFISTIVFYIVMKMYKISIIKNQKKKKNNSNLIYILFVPALLYLTHFIFLNPNNNINLLKTRSISDELLTEPYPASNNSI